MAFLGTVGINVMYNVVNHARGEPTAPVSPATWWTNLRHGLEWDQNAFVVNQFGHPFQGSGFMTSGRAFGLSFWESSAVAAFGSVTWEFFGENNRASLNDVINTTLGGIALGEIVHRTAWLIRDTRATGRRRYLREVAAAAIDPFSGLARLVSGEASRVMEAPASGLPGALRADLMVGVLWQGATARAIHGPRRTFAQVDVLYGDPGPGRVRTPYEAFAIRARVGGGATLSEARVRGTLFGYPLGAQHQLTVSQTFDFASTPAFSFGGQGVESGLETRRSLSAQASMSLSGWVGLTVLGAVDTPSMSIGGGEGPRDYDYGPGSTFGATARMLWNGRQYASLSYRGYQLYIVDGQRAKHVLQRAELDVELPMSRLFAVGVSAEYFLRRTSFASGVGRRDRFSQLRVYLAKTLVDDRTPRTDLAGPSASAPAGASRLWLMGGGAASVARTGCLACDAAGAFRRSAGVVANVGVRVSRQMHAGAELAWLPGDLESEEPTRTTFVLGVAQFRPWAARGFFVKGGMGLGLVRNWILDSDSNPKPRLHTGALALGYGAGWIFRRERPLAIQIHATHHVAAVGNLTANRNILENVVGNFWMLGAGVVVRGQR